MRAEERAVLVAHDVFEEMPQGCCLHKDHGAGRPCGLKSPDPINLISGDHDVQPGQTYCKYEDCRFGKEEKRNKSRVNILRCKGNPRWYSLCPKKIIDGLYF